MKSKLIIGVFLLGFSLNLSAQKLSKEEERALKNEIKTKLKNLESYTQMKAQNQELGEQIKERMGQINNLKYQLSALKLQTNERDGMIAQLQKDVNNSGRKLTSGVDGKPHEVVFKVQIGAYRNQKIARFLQKNTNFTIEEDENGVKKYLMGNFDSYKEAKNLSDKLLRKGASSYVVGYLDGNRIQNLKQMPAEFL